MRSPPRTRGCPKSLPIRLRHPVIPLFLKQQSININGLVLISFRRVRARAREATKWSCRLGVFSLAPADVMVGSQQQRRPGRAPVAENREHCE
jgi:hypothetical protein